MHDRSTTKYLMRLPLTLFLIGQKIQKMISAGRSARQGPPMIGASSCCFLQVIALCAGVCVGSLL